MRTLLSLAILAALASAQPAQFPDTYSFSALGSMMGPMATIEVHRNSTREMIEITNPGGAGKFHQRTWYDFAAHRQYILNLNSNLCTTQEYRSPYAPSLYDTVGGAAEMAGEISKVPAQAWRKETLNGIAVKSAEFPGEEAKAKYWLDEKSNFVVKMDLGIGKEPMTTRFEIKRISYQPSPESLFATPRYASRWAAIQLLPEATPKCPRRCPHRELTLSDRSNSPLRRQHLPRPPSAGRRR